MLVNQCNTSARLHAGSQFSSYEYKATLSSSTCGHTTNQPPFPVPNVNATTQQSKALSHHCRMNNKLATFKSLSSISTSHPPLLIHLQAHPCRPAPAWQPHPGTLPLRKLTTHLKDADPLRPSSRSTARQFLRPGFCTKCNWRASLGGAGLPGGPPALPHIVRQCKPHTGDRRGQRLILWRQCECLSQMP